MDPNAIDLEGITKEAEKLTEELHVKQVIKNYNFLIKHLASLRFIFLEGTYR